MTAACTPIDRYPLDLVQAIIHEAMTEADMVGTFLSALGLAPVGAGQERKPVHMPAALLLGLGAAMRLLRWEQSGVCAHLPHNLPPSQEVICQLFGLAASPRPSELDPLARELMLRLFTVWLRWCAWSGPGLLDADFVLGDIEEDELVEVLAAFLWKHRDSGLPPQEGGER